MGQLFYPKTITTTTTFLLQITCNVYYQKPQCFGQESPQFLPQNIAVSCLKHCGFWYSFPVSEQYMQSY